VGLERIAGPFAEAAGSKRGGRESQIAGHGILDRSCGHLQRLEGTIFAWSKAATALWGFEGLDSHWRGQRRAWSRLEAVIEEIKALFPGFGLLLVCLIDILQLHSSH
jgi:hypothetical protein